MEKLLSIISIIALSAIIIKWTYDAIKLRLIFKVDGYNPYRRTCRKCGANQSMYQSLFGSWWGETYPLGNDPNCQCHKYAEDRDW